jgi:type II secretory pathway component PulF
MTQPNHRPPIIPLAYESPEPRPAGSWGIWVAYFMLWSAVALILTFACLFIVPKFTAIFMDFKVALPLGTQILIAFSRWFQHYGWAIVWLMSFGIAFAMSAATWRSPAPWRTFRLAHRLLWVLVALLIAFCVWALYAPMLNLVTAVSGK